MPPLTLIYDFVFIRRERLWVLSGESVPEGRAGELFSGISEDFEQVQSSLAAPDVRPASLRCLTLGGGTADAAVQGMRGGSKPKVKLPS